MSRSFLSMTSLSDTEKSSRHQRGTHEADIRVEAMEGRALMSAVSSGMAMAFEQRLAHRAMMMAAREQRMLAMHEMRAARFAHMTPMAARAAFSAGGVSITHPTGPITPTSKVFYSPVVVTPPAATVAASAGSISITHPTGPITPTSKVFYGPFAMATTETSGTTGATTEAAADASASGSTPTITHPTGPVTPTSKVFY
jgi:hypothetical protein